MNQIWQMSLASIVLLATSGALQADQPAVVSVDPGRSVIVVETIPDNPAALRGHAQIAWEAVVELQKHLKLVTGTEVPIAPEAPEAHFPFFIGVAPEGTDLDALADQETRWEITPGGAYLYGGNARDTQYAVYGFLQDQLGIEWIRPGDFGIVYRERNPLTLQVGTFNWTPELLSRSIRPGKRRVTRLGRGGAFGEFQQSLETYNREADDGMQWYRRMRMGGRSPIATHAFSGWWPRFGETNPEYFALNKHGKREPVPGSKNAESWVKICPSNPKVAEQVIADWLPRKGPIISVGVNDGTQNFCECPDCRALDVTREGEAWSRHLTDRYVVLANRVARLAREHREDVYVTMYAYMTMLDPPRRERIEPNVIITFVPYVDPLHREVVREHYNGWREMGATKFALRPNYHHMYLRGIVIPFGVAKEFFDVFQEAYSQGCLGTNYDCIIDNWPNDSIVNYILARSMGEPDKPFDHWASLYYSAYGAAAEDVQAYFEYWRNEIWEGRLKPGTKEILGLGGGNSRRGIMWSLGEYYRADDFEITDQILAKAAKRDLTETERMRLRELQLYNEHARRTFEVVVAPPYESVQLAGPLKDYRREIKDELPLNWLDIFSTENNMIWEDLGQGLEEYRTPWLQTDLLWKFKFEPDFKVDPTLPRPEIYAYDPESQPEWHKQTWEQVSDWDEFRTDRVYGQQVEGDQLSNFSPETDAIMAAAPESGYIGVGWYATRQAVPKDWKGREIYLRLGAVDESAWIYINGQFAGKRYFEYHTDWYTPFSIRIDPFIDWDRDEQMIMVRVQNTQGLGGLWKRSWVVSK